MTTAGAAGPFTGSRSGLQLGVALWWCAVLVLTATAVRLVLALRVLALPNDGDADMVASVVAATGGAAVAASIALRTPRNPVGWLLLTMFTTFALDGVAAYYPGWAAHRGGPAADVVAGLERPLWVVILALLGATLLLVPDGRLPGPRWRYVAAAGAILAPLTYVVLLVVPDGAFTGASAGLRDPFSLAPLDSTAGHVARAVCAISTLAVVAACAASLVVRFRRGDPETRRQLSWVLLGALTVPMFVVALFTTRVLYGPTGAPTALVESAGFDVMLVGIPLSIALAMARYRLYSVDAVVDSTLAWLAASGILLATLSGVVLLVGAWAGSGTRSSPVAVATITAVAVLVARPLHRELQRSVNRRFHRRSFDAVGVVEAYVDRLRRGEASLDDLEPLLRLAVGDPGLVVVVPVEDRWVRLDGSPVAEPADAVDAWEVARAGAAMARLVRARLRPRTGRCAKPPRPPRWPSRTPGSAPRPSPSWPRCVLPGSASSRLSTRSGGDSSATSTTAHSSG